MALIVQPQARALRPVSHAPRLSAASCDLLREIRVVDEHRKRRQIHLPAERPLSVFVDDRELMTLTTLGAAPELLVLGHLLNQRLVGDVSAIESITVDWKSGAAAVKTRTGNLDTDGVGRIASTGCSLRMRLSDLMRQVETKTLPKGATARISQRTLLRVLGTVRGLDAIHRIAGSVHSCALFQGAELFVSVEDVSRHNAIDTIAGWMALHGVAGGDKILFTTGRLNAEMVMRAAHNGIPILVSRNGVTAMGYELAMKLGMMVFIRAANRRFLCCVGVERFDTEPAAD